MESRVLGNRYELVEKIGGGGMAVVYKAKCRLLNRFVAVKILRQEFTNDEEFVKRFRIEAQAAASLSHPNIVSIYDVGQEDNVHYIVMEYIDGITLKDYIVKRGALNWKEAVNIAAQICSAIEQAHRNHIIHRDIKPHNILLTKDGIAKVTDFGIARAVSSSTITMVGSTIGSVHYFSPEQARGGFIDEKSDLYSLGIALYEMVTGRVPFDGESPVAVALKHIQNQPEEPKELNGSIPGGINDIIMKSIMKEQSARYQSASEMLSDLNRVLKEPDGGFISDLSLENSPTKKIQAVGGKTLEQDLAVEEQGSSNKEKKKDRLTIWLAIITSLIIISIFTYIGYSIVIPSILPEPSNFTVKNYVGKNFDEVSEELQAAGIEARKKGVFDDKEDKNVIISQSVSPDQPLKPGSQGFIEFEVSEGPRLVKVPDLRTEDYRVADADLKRLGLETKIAEEYNDTIGKDLVIKTDPGADEEIKPGTEITVYKSLGPELKQVPVPNVTGMTRAEAQKAILDSKLAIGKMFPEDKVSDVDKINKQVPAAGTLVDEGTRVDLYFESQEEQATQATQGQEEQTQAGQRVIVSEKLALNNPDDYGDQITVAIEVTPSDTNKTEVLMNRKWRKDRFPLTVEIPVPVNGSTSVVVLYDNAEYARFVRQDTGN